MANPSKNTALLADKNQKGMRMNNAGPMGGDFLRNDEARRLLKVIDIANRQALVADAVVAHALNSTFSDTEAEAALDALGVKINAILDILEAHGLMADA